MSKIRAKCCDTLLESKHRHDLVVCKCEKVFLDGGNDYMRLGYPPGPRDEHVEVLEDVKKDPEDNT